MNAAIIVIAKSPVAGRVKTRLCPPCTPEQAAEIAAASLADTLATVASTPARAHVVALDGAVGPWIPDGYVVVPQIGRGLDARIANAFASITGPALLIGMDTPQLTSADLAGALRMLGEPAIDAVLGPACDGGWWTIGLRRADPRVFVGVEMSTAHTYDAQCARLDELGLRTATLPVLRDVDTWHDAVIVAADAPDGKFAQAVAAVENVTVDRRATG